MNSDLLHYSAARACVSPSLSPHCSHADGWTFWLLWCNSASSGETSRMTCLKLGRHLNCHLQIDLRLFCPPFNLEGLCSLWSGSCITTLAWNRAQPNKSCPLGLCHTASGAELVCVLPAWTTGRRLGRLYVNMAQLRWCPGETVVLSHHCLLGAKQ